MFEHEKFSLELKKILDSFEEVEIRTEAMPENLIKEMLQSAISNQDIVYPKENLKSKLEKHIYSNGLCYTNLVLAYEDELEQYVITEDKVSVLESEQELVKLFTSKKIQTHSKMIDSSFTTPDSITEVVTVLVGDKNLAYSNNIVNRFVSPVGKVIKRNSPQSNKLFSYDLGNGCLLAEVKQNGVLFKAMNGDEISIIGIKTLNEFNEELLEIVKCMPNVVNEHLEKKVYSINN